MVGLISASRTTRAVIGLSASTFSRTVGYPKHSRSVDSGALSKVIACLSSAVWSRGRSGLAAEPNELVSMSAVPMLSGAPTALRSRARESCTPGGGGVGASVGPR